MSDRRTFLGSVASAGFAVCFCAPSLAASIKTSDLAGASFSERIHWLIDGGNRANIEFAKVMASQGHPVHMLPASIDPKWSNALFERLSAESASLQCISNMADYFVLSRMALDAGLKIVQPPQFMGDFAKLLVWSVVHPDKLTS